MTKTSFIAESHTALEMFPWKERYRRVQEETVAFWHLFHKRNTPGFDPNLFICGHFPKIRLGLRKSQDSVLLVEERDDHSSQMAFETFFA
jgi:hypothetical protein